MNLVFDMMAAGSFLAEHVRAGDADALLKLLRVNLPDHPGRVEQDEFIKWEFARAWHDNGYPRVNLGHKHAAALMATNTKPASIPDARAPWDAFMVDVPDGLVEIEHEGKTIAITRAFVRSRRDSVFVLHGNDRMVAGYFFSETPSVAEFGDFSKAGPAINLLGRLALGVCMEMTSTTYKGERLGSRPVKRDPRSGEPKTWTFALTRDVKVDCRDAVRAYSRGQTHTSPTVQTLVRGHWKQQTCGKGGADRKNIFVEPYWRGPEDAHIALRKHAVRHPDDAATDATT